MRAEPRNPSHWMLFVEFPVATSIFIVASLNLAYRSITVITVLSALFLFLFRAYLNLRYRIRIPFLVLLLAFAAVEIDTVGNYLQLYRRLPWPVPYDVFAHITIPAMLAPALVWLTRAWFEKLGYKLPLSVVCFISVNVNFSLSGFYEIVELWDDLYFGGTRIWEIYDTSRDLQNGLLGAVIGTAISYAVLRLSEREVFRQCYIEIGHLFGGEPEHVKSI
ncbi:MAG: hypothetical protein MOB07_28955 [Acidobacteria bacterium]|nr:hypothetical protein [Acidobacteriota bacterium]